jgi:hypothetical protein
MAEVTVSTPYASAIPFIVSDLPGWVDEYNAQRLASYDLYDDLYANVPDTTIALLRGSDEKPITLPSGKRLINTLARYVGRGWGYVVDPALGTAAQQEALTIALSNLWRRERIESQCSSGKREWLRRGDWVWYISANEAKPEGRRITVRTIDPRTYFPIEDDDDLDHLLGAELIEETMVGETQAIKVQTWLKPQHIDSLSFSETGVYSGDEPITYSSYIYDLKDWNVPEKRKVLEELSAPVELEGILTLPLYHVKNQPSSGDPYGTSEFQGMESIIAGINQAITDEDLALSMAGLGQFVTDAGAPIDPDSKQPTNWKMGPASVTEVGTGKKFERLAGITSVDPVQKHVAYLEEHLYGTSGVNDIALGKGSVQLSGIAMAIKMQPLFDAADDRDLQLNDVMTQMIYDLITMWFPQFEGLNFGEAMAYSATDTGDRLPFDREARWKELVEGYTAGIFALGFVHRELVEKFGMDLSKQDLQDALDEAAAKAAAADPYAQRAGDELNDGSAQTDSTADDANATAT